MDEDSLIEKTLESSGNKHKYQYLLLILTTLIWVNVDLIGLTVPFLEKQPEVNYIDPVTKENITTQLNYTICKTIKDYKKTKVYGHSWVSEFGIECSKFENDLIGTLLFVGTTIGIFYNSNIKTS